MCYEAFEYLSRFSDGGIEDVFKFRAACFLASYLSRLFVPLVASLSQKWQNLQSSPSVHPSFLFQKKRQGRHLPASWASRVLNFGSVTCLSPLSLSEKPKKWAKSILDSEELRWFCREHSKLAVDEMLIVFSRFLGLKWLKSVGSLRFSKFSCLTSPCLGGDTNHGDKDSCGPFRTFGSSPNSARPCMFTATNEPARLT